MRAVLLTGNGGLSQLQYTESHPVPSLQNGQALVKNHISGINFVDIYYRTGVYPSTTGFPSILGQEAAGTIVAVGEPNPCQFKVGYRVLWIAQGGYAECTAIPFERLVRIPSEISDQSAVGAHLME